MEKVFVIHGYLENSNDLIWHKHPRYFVHHLDIFWLLVMILPHIVPCVSHKAIYVLHQRGYEFVCWTGFATPSETFNTFTISQTSPQNKPAIYVVSSSYPARVSSVQTEVKFAQDHRLLPYKHVLAHRTKPLDR